MPKNSLTILNDFFYSNLFKPLCVRYQGALKELYYGYSKDAPSFTVEYQNGKIMFQYVSIHDDITIAFFKEKNDEHPSYIKALFSRAPMEYRAKKEKMEKVSQILLECVNDGCNMDAVISAIDKL